MIRRVYTAYMVEITKAIRLKFSYVAPLLVVLVIGAALLTHPVERDDTSDYDFIAYATPLALNVLGFMLLLIYCASLVSSELGSGTIRMVLVRPLRRREFLAAKLLIGMTYATGLSLLAAITAWGLAYALGDLTGVRYGDEVVFTDSEMRVTYALALVLNLFPQFAAVTYAILVSTCTRSTGASVGITIGLWLLADSVKYPLRVAPFLFSSYMESSWQVFANRCNALDTQWFPAAQYGIISSIAAAILFFSIALYVLSRRNLST